MNSTRQTSIHLLLQGSIVRTQEIYRAAPQGPDIRSRQFPLTSFGQSRLLKSAFKQRLIQRAQTRWSKPSQKALVFLKFCLTSLQPYKMVQLLELTWHVLI